MMVAVVGDVVGALCWVRSSRASLLSSRWTRMLFALLGFVKQLVLLVLAVGDLFRGPVSVVALLVRLVVGDDVGCCVGRQWTLGRMLFRVRVVPTLLQIGLRSLSIRCLKSPRMTSPILRLIASLVSDLLKVLSSSCGLIGPSFVLMMCLLRRRESWPLTVQSVWPRCIVVPLSTLVTVTLLLSPRLLISLSLVLGAPW